MKKQPIERLHGRTPKIGIRPTIDGRRNGVREALEEKTMTLARNAAGLISGRLRTINGAPVECVISDTTIGGLPEAADCAAKFEKEGVCAVLTVTPSWCYPTETMDMNPLIPKAVWGFNGTERPGAVYLAGLASAHDQKGLPVFKLYGRDIQDIGDHTIPEEIQQQILSYARCAISLGTMRGKTYLSMGGVSMGIASSVVDHDFFQAYLGMKCQQVDMSEFVRRINKKIYDPDEFQKALKWVKRNCREMEDPNPPGKRETAEQKRENWETIIKMALITKDLMTGNPRLKEMGYPEESAGHNAIAAGFQGQRQWTDFMPTGDFMEAILNSSFDWNGPRQPYILATENDNLNAVSMLLGHLLTGAAQLFADVRTYWSPPAIQRITGTKLKGPGENGFIYLTNSGAAALDGCGECLIEGKPGIKPYWEMSKEDVLKCLKATRWGSGKLWTFRGGGFSSSFETRSGMPMTMSRLNLVKGLGPVLQIAEGCSIDLPVGIHDTVVGRTDPTWPRTFFVPRITGKGAFRDVYTVMKKWGSNHCALCFGHIGADLITLASMLRIPINMSNVAEEKIFRPTYWNACGTENMEQADYRACSLLGPLYGKY